MGLYSGGLTIGRIFASEIWGAYFIYLFIYLFIYFFGGEEGGGGGEREGERLLAEYCRA